MRISDWSSDVCSSDLRDSDLPAAAAQGLLDRVEHAEVAGQVDDVPLLGQRPLQPAQIARRVVHVGRSEEHTSELQSLMRISYAVFCLKKKTKKAKTKSHVSDN